MRTNANHKMRPGAAFFLGVSASLALAAQAAAQTLICPAGMAPRAQSGNADAFDTAGGDVNTPENALGPILAAGETGNNNNTARLRRIGPELTLDLTDLVPENGVITLSIARNNNNGVMDILLSDNAASGFVFVGSFGNGGSLGSSPVNPDLLQHIQVQAPAGGARFVRFFRTRGGMRVDGVEYQDICVQVRDYGDAPASYGEASAGIAPDLRLGGLVDGDDVSQSDPQAQGDDADGSDDEDGVRLAGGDLQDQSLTIGERTVLSVNAVGGGVLNAWVDFNASRQFEAGEQIATDLPLVNGANLLELDVPPTATAGETFARFRLCRTAGTCASPASSPPNPDGEGEVEDYRIFLAEPGMRLSGQVFEDNGAGGVPAHDGARASDEIGLAGVLVRAFDDADASGAHEAGETVFGETVTDADGRYMLALDDAAAGRAVTTTTALAGPQWLHVSQNPNVLASGGAAALPGLVNPNLADGAMIFVPAANETYTDANFGQVRQPTLSGATQGAAAPGGVAAFPFRSRAAASGEVVFVVAAVSQTPDPTVFSEIQILLDANGDQRLDAGDTLLAGPATVSEGDEINLLLRVQAAAGAPPDARLDAALTALTDFNAAPVDLAPFAVGGDANACAAAAATAPTGFDIDHCIAVAIRINGAEQSLLAVEKTVCNETEGEIAFATDNRGDPGDILVYRLRVENIGAEPAFDPHILDATPALTRAAGAVVAAPLGGPLAPAPASCPGVISFAPAGIAGCAVSAPVSGGAGDVAWRCTGALNPGDRGEFFFQVEVKR